MKILLLGKNGQVGWELQRSLAPLGELLALDSRSPDYCGDLSDLSGLAATVQRFAPDVIVNAAAYTAVDKAESEPDLAHTINAVAPGRIAEELARTGGLLIHYSTDYVFDGDKPGSYEETDSTGPLNVYGASKLDGERAIKQSDARAIVFRTSWVYGARGSNFLLTMLRLAQERAELQIVDDQIGAPTSSECIAQATANILAQLLAPAGRGLDGRSGI